MLRAVVLAAHGAAGDLEDALFGLGLAVLVVVVLPWLVYRVMGKARGEYFLRTLKGQLSDARTEGFKPGWWTNYDEASELADAPCGAHGQPIEDRQAVEPAAAAPATPPPSEQREMRYWLSRTWKHEGLLNPRGWIEPTQFLLKDESGQIVYRMVALWAWSERRMSIQDVEGRYLASLNRGWRPQSFDLIRGNRLEATITFKDPFWRWRDRYVVKAGDGTKMVAVEAGVGSGVYQFIEDGETLGRYSQRGSLEVAEGADPLLLAAVALSIVLGPSYSG